MIIKVSVVNSKYYFRGPCAARDILKDMQERLSKLVCLEYSDGRGEMTIRGVNENDFEEIRGMGIIILEPPTPPSGKRTASRSRRFLVLFCN